jgi:hypothetical protein
MTDTSSGLPADEDKGSSQKDKERLDGIAAHLKSEPELLRLHHELSDPAVGEAASQCRLVWAQVKGFPWWPVCFARSGSIRPVLIVLAPLV